MMRILLVHNRYRSDVPSGENVVVDDEAGLLEEYGCVVERLELSSDDIASWPLHRRASLPLRVVWSREGDRLVGDAIARFAPDVVHVHNTFPLFSPSVLRAARRSGTAVVQTLHNFRPLCPAATFFRDGAVCEECLGRLPLPALRHGCYRESRTLTAPLVAMSSVHRLAETWRRCVDLSITPSDFTRRKYLAAGWPESRLAVKYNTVRDPGAPRVGPGSGFVCISRLGPEKGVELLLDAWRVAFPRGEALLTILGSGVDEAEIRRRAAVTPGVELRGQVSRSDAAAALAGARAVLVPSRCYEGFPRVVAEAFAAGVPVVASRLGALAEIVEDGVTGLLVRPGDPVAAAQAVGVLERSDEMSCKLGRSARDAFRLTLSGAATTRRLIQLYERVVAARARRGAFHDGTARAAAG